MRRDHEGSPGRDGLVISELARDPSEASKEGAPAGEMPFGVNAAMKHILVVEDERGIRESLGDLLEEEGYQVSYAENGQEALRRLYAHSLPDIIIFDLRMPVMDGWEFRAVQKDDPKLGAIPVVAISADSSAQAVTISAQAYLRKPLDVGRLLRTLERILFESERRRMAERLEEAERLASLGRLAAGVGHEINNPLTFSILNLNESLAKLRKLDEARKRRMDRRMNGASSPTDEPAASSASSFADSRPAPEADMKEVTEMLEDCRIGLERIHETVGNLQRLSRKEYLYQARLDLHQLIDQSVSIAWNQIRHRARLVRRYGTIPPVAGNATALGQVFLNLLVNAAQATPEGDADGNEISISTRAEGYDVIIEISDTGKGIAADTLSHLFEPFFTTKPVGIGTGLGLSISRQAVIDAGGRIEVESEPGKGSRFRVVLPAVRENAPEVPASAISPEKVKAGRRGRVLVIDDEPLVGRAVRAALSADHDVAVFERATDALARLAEGEVFDLILCDVVMPDVSGPTVYNLIAQKWPEMLPRLAFMTGGAFTPTTMSFLDRNLTPVVRKPFDIQVLRSFVRQYVREEHRDVARNEP